MVPEKFSRGAVSVETIMNFTVVPVATVTLLSFGPGGVVLVAGVGGELDTS